MKRFLSLLFLIAFFLSPVYSFAQATSSTPVATNPLLDETRVAISTGFEGFEEVNDIIKSDQLTEEQLNPSKCNLFSKGNLLSCIDTIIAWLIKTVFLNFAGIFLWLAANLFNYSISIGILNFKMWEAETLYPLWVFVRQVISLLVVFIGLYLGFMYILGKEEKFARYVPWVIIFALFVNFSYPAVRVVIDVSNVVSLNLYTATFGSETLNGSSTNTPGSIIMNKLGLQELALAATQTGSDTVSNTSSNLVKSINSTPAALLVVVFVFYAAYVLFYASFLVIARTISLVGILVISPILFIDSILPMLGDRAKFIRKVFFDQLAFAPVLIGLLALTLQFITVFGAISKTAPGMQGGGAAPATLQFFSVLVMVVALHFTFKIAKSFSGAIGETVTEAVGKVGGFALGGALAGTGMLARKGIGGLASRLKDKEGGWIQRNRGTFVGEKVHSFADSLSKSSFDLRNSDRLTNTLSKAGFKDLGKGSTIGYEQAMENRRKEILDKGARIKTRYERDVRDPKTGEMLHKAGDVNEDAERAQARFISNVGTAKFLPKEEKEKLREALGTQADEASAKAIAKAKELAQSEIANYKRLKSDAERNEFVTELNNDLAKAKKTDPDLRGDIGQSLLMTLREIESDQKDRELEFNKRVELFVEKHKRIENLVKDKTEREKQQEALLISLEEKELEAVQKRLKGEPSQPTTKSASTLDFEIPDNTNTAWEGNRTNVPAYLRKGTDPFLSPTTANTETAPTQKPSNLRLETDREASARLNGGLSLKTKGEANARVNRDRVLKKINEYTDAIRTAHQAIDKAQNSSKGTPPAAPTPTTTSPTPVTPQAGGAAVTV